MTPTEHKKEEIRLKGAITRAKNQLQGPMTLREKIVAKGKVRETEENLRQHRLHFHTLTATAI